MKTTKVIEITLRTVITYDEDKHSLHAAAEKIAAQAANEEGIYDAKELVGNRDFDPDSYIPFEVM